jgi:hypothetical protein
VKNVVAITPIRSMALRLNWSPTAENPKPPMVPMMAGPRSSHWMSVPVRCSGALASTSSEPVINRS